MIKYVLAISGGIDSVAMLDMIASNYDDVRRIKLSDAKWPDDFVVAHFDHGIRGEASHHDAMFVRDLAESYGVRCRIGRGNLPSDTSEDEARLARYAFLNECLVGCGGEGRIATAHHRDDLLETVVMNLIRGTGWRGLAPMNNSQIVRPLLNWSKVELAKYVLERNLSWVEDVTNYSVRYFRNRVRACLANVNELDKRKLLQLAKKQLELRRLIDQEVAHYIDNHVRQLGGVHVMKRYDLIMLPTDCAVEVIRSLTNDRLTLPQTTEALMFVKTAKPRKKHRWGDVLIETDKQLVCFAVNQ